MTYVIGIGGHFFGADDPKTMSDWYATHLGIPDGTTTFWAQDAGPTVASAFRQASDYVPADRTAMLNLRVRNLSGLSRKPESAGIEVQRNSGWNCEPGLFAAQHACRS